IQTELAAARGSGNVAGPIAGPAAAAHGDSAAGGRRTHSGGSRLTLAACGEIPTAATEHSYSDERFRPKWNRRQERALLRRCHGKMRFGDWRPFVRLL